MRLIAMLLFSLIPPGKVRALLFDREFLQRHSWVTLTVLAVVQVLIYVWAGLMMAGVV